MFVQDYCSFIVHIENLQQTFGSAGGPWKNFIKTSTGLEGVLTSFFLTIFFCNNSCFFWLQMKKKNNLWSLTWTSLKTD